MHVTADSSCSPTMSTLSGALAATPKLSPTPSPASSTNFLHCSELPASENVSFHSNATSPVSDTHLPSPPSPSFSEFPGFMLVDVSGAATPASTLPASDDTLSPLIPPAQNISVSPSSSDLPLQLFPPAQDCQSVTTLPSPSGVQSSQNEHTQNIPPVSTPCQLSSMLSLPDSPASTDASIPTGSAVPGMPTCLASAGASSPLAPQPVTPFQLCDFRNPVGLTLDIPQDSEPYDYFSLIFTDTLLQHIADETNKYAEQNPVPSYNWYPTSVPELKLFLGMIIAMGIKKLPALEDYWSVNPYIGTPEIVARMPRLRFKALMRFLHLNDNSTMKARGEPGYDRLHKLRPLLDALNKQIKAYYNPNREVSVDEAMVAFKGRIGFKQYMPMKPVKRGYKIWSLADSCNGYMYHFEVYTGKDEQKYGTGLGERVVLKLTESLPRGHIVFYDNFFSSIALGESLLNRGLYSCGTTRVNRRGFPAELKTTQLPLRGDHRSCVVDRVEALIWKDKKVVSFLNTAYDSSQIEMISRKEMDGSRKNISSPEPVRMYNSFMGGVDLADQKRNLYSCSRKSMKWWFRLFYFCLDIAIVNSHILYGLDYRHVDQKRFRILLFSHLMSFYNARRILLAPRSPITLLRSSDHHADRAAEPRQCRLCVGRKRTRTVCRECGVHLCRQHCFSTWHSSGEST